MTPDVIAAIAGSSVVSSVIGGAFVAWLHRRKENAERRKLAAEALSAESLTNEELHHRLMKLRSTAAASEQALMLARVKVDKLQGDLIAAYERIATLQNGRRKA